jgi:predicted nucleic acid-binding protein
MADGLLDTNVFVHALLHDDHSHECQRFLTRVQTGEIRARLEPLVVHELTYMLPRVIKQMDRSAVADLLVGILGWEGIQADRSLLMAAINRLRNGSGLGFVDAYLCAAAELEQRSVYTKNLRDFAGQGVAVPDPLRGA